MRVLLINSNRFKQPWPVIPIGLCAIAAATEAAGHTVKVLDLCFSRKPEPEIQNSISSFQPDVLGISIRNLDNCAGCDTQFLLEDVYQEVVMPCKNAFSGPIIIGGPAVGISGSEMLEYMDLEFAIRGDGEAAFVAFLDCLNQIKQLKNQESDKYKIAQDTRNSRPALESIKGLVWRRAGRIVASNPPDRPETLDALPWPRAYRYINVKQYASYGSPVQVQTKRGCALNCSYCTYNRIEGKRWRFRSPAAVVDEIQEIVAKTGVNKIEFSDSAFNVPAQHCKAVLREIISRDLNVKLHTLGLNPTAVDEELVHLMKQAGFHDVDFGAESGCDATLEGLGKSYRRDEVKMAVRLLHKYDIKVNWFLLLGGPGESLQTLEETFTFVEAEAAAWDLICIGVGLRVYAGSPLAQRIALEEPSSSKDNFFRPHPYRPKGVTLDALKLWTRKRALSNTNFFLYGEEETMPPVPQKIASMLMKLLTPNQPFWRLIILLRKTQEVLGIRKWKRSRFQRKHGEEIKDLEHQLKTAPVKNGSGYSCTTALVNSNP